MKYLFILSLVLASCGNTTAQQDKSKPLIATKGFEPVAVIELFTSQGCSSCPPADELLKQTIANANGKKIFALSFHVDYWNRLGWTDPFSSAVFSQRQSDYVKSMGLDGAYTPQAVINGAKELVGSDQLQLKKAIDNALAHNSTVQFNTLQAVYNNDNTISVQYHLDGACQGCKVVLALVSLQETTSVKRGENSGATLSGTNIVRQLIAQQATPSGSVHFAAAPAPEKNNTAIIAFVQDEKTLQINGAATATF